MFVNGDVRKLRCHCIYVRTQWEDGCVCTCQEEEASPADTLMLAFQPPELWRNLFLSSVKWSKDPFSGSSWDSWAQRTCTRSVHSAEPVCGVVARTRVRGGEWGIHLCKVPTLSGHQKAQWSSQQNVKIAHKDRLFFIYNPVLLCKGNISKEAAVSWPCNPVCLGLGLRGLTIMYKQIGQCRAVPIIF